MLEKLQQLKRGIVIEVNHEEFVRDIKMGSKDLVWYSLKTDKEYTDKQIFELIKKYY